MNEQRPRESVQAVFDKFRVRVGSYGQKFVLYGQLGTTDSGCELSRLREGDAGDGTARALEGN
jgi:hypothetical protein